MNNWSERRVATAHDTHLDGVHDTHQDMPHVSEHNTSGIAGDAGFLRVLRFRPAHSVDVIPQHGVHQQLQAALAIVHPAYSGRKAYT